MNLEKFWGILNYALNNANLTGSLLTSTGVTADREPFKELSFRTSGPKAFIVKGWVDTKGGPAIRYRADWDNLGNGEIFYQENPGDKGWQETSEQGFKLERGDGEISIVIEFYTGDGAKREVKFTADIEMGSVFEMFLKQ